jgi:Ca2+-binding EF-hand superfamily protein
MSLEIKTLHKQAFREIFNLVAGKDGKLEKKGLAELFRVIDYNITEEQFNDMVSKLYTNKKETISFEEFMKIFQLKLQDYTTVDVKNAFRLIAKDDDNFIPSAKIKKILVKHGLGDVEIQFLMRQLDKFTDPQGRVNYNDFLKSLSIN